MLLDHLLDATAVSDVRNARGGVEVTDLAYDSRRVRAGALFFCIPGRARDGHDHAAEAAARGATALVCERPLPVSLPQAIVPDARAAMAPLADSFFGHPSSELRVIGVTGTNGKTTTTHLVRSILESAGIACGLIGTLGVTIGGASEDAERTTGEAIDLQRSFRRMLAANDKACAMEVSSHALALHRADAIRFAAVVFTNLSQDHLDFHGSLERYFSVKASVFDGRFPRAVNNDDAYARRLDAELRFGTTTGASVRADTIEFGAATTRFRLVTPTGGRDVQTRLVGEFNVENALAAASAALLVGVSLDDITGGLEAAPGVPGRFETVSEGQPFVVLVDYAHTPDALSGVLHTARPLCRRTLRVVFGCGGDRDRGKRPLMGAVATALADDVILTSDNPRGEQPESIISDIQAGVTRPVTVEPDRRRAITLGIERCQPGDVLVIAGKGHEQGQDVGGRTTPFDDRSVAREALA